MQSLVGLLGNTGSRQRQPRQAKTKIKSYNERGRNWGFQLELITWSSWTGKEQQGRQNWLLKASNTNEASRELVIDQLS